MRSGSGWSSPPTSQPVGPSFPFCQLIGQVHRPATYKGLEGFAVEWTFQKEHHYYVHILATLSWCHMRFAVEWVVLTNVLTLVEFVVAARHSDHEVSDAWVFWSRHVDDTRLVADFHLLSFSISILFAFKKTNFVSSSCWLSSSKVTYYPKFQRDFFFSWPL